MIAIFYYINIFKADDFLR